MIMKKDAPKPKKKELFGWGEKKYTKEEVLKLMELIKEFNCGAIDNYLSKHVDKAYKDWVKNTK